MRIISFIEDRGVIQTIKWEGYSVDALSAPVVEADAIRANLSSNPGRTFP